MKSFPRLLAALVFNLAWMIGLGALTLDVFATAYTKACALIFSVLIPLAINSYWPTVRGYMRTLRFGGGLIVYFILCLISIPFTAFLGSFLLPCLVISLGLLWWGVRLPAFPSEVQIVAEEQLELKKTEELLDEELLAEERILYAEE